MPSKHTRKIDHPAPLPPAQRAAMIRRLATVDAAIRAGRVKVVNPPQNCAFKPRMEIYDDPEASHIFATLELPGVKTTDFGIAFKPGALELTGVRPARLPMHTQDRPPYASQHEDMDVDSGNTSGSYERASSLFPLHELRYGTFNRTIPLPDGVDGNSVVASLNEGLLTISWPRGTTTEPVTRTGTNLDAVVVTPDLEPTTGVQRPTSSIRGDPAAPTGHANGRSTRSQTQRQD
uniref:SHSP domain-containing protein n=1 Tax=Mycena chlorophos TaxID=658473 RepID=A0ABQ0KX19_MYCCL|nr:predicted protein [Mycena chlorophos]